MDFDRARIAIRRARVRNQLTTPKSGRGRNVAMTTALAEALFDLLAERRREAPTRGRRETPECRRERSGFLERETGVEPATLGLGSRCSTTELLPLGFVPIYR